MRKDDKKVDLSGVEFWLSMICAAIFMLQLHTCIGFQDVKHEIMMLKYK